MTIEFKKTCCNCNKTGDNTFARIFYKKIEGEWKYLCYDCWNKF